VWQQDPVDLFRRWRLRRRPGALVDDVLDLLRGIGPALGAGLTPSRAIELAATSTLGAERVRLAREASGRRSRRSSAASSPRSRRPWSGFASEEQRTVPVADIDRLVGGLLDASDRAEPTSPVWAQWAARSASQELALVAAAWRLSESTGAPLASAVDRAVRGLLDARARRGKVAVAVAGPRATVTVLTLLPLTGPLFGLACGIDPATLYLGSPVATVSVLLGLLLVSVGRFWCTRMVRRAVRP
jgi:tight adherence protein B